MPGASTGTIGIAQFSSGFLAKGRAKRDEEKKQVVSGLQHVMSLEALDMLGKYMDDPALMAEAEMSAANLIWNLRGRHPTEVRTVAKRLVESKNRTVAGKARKTIADLDKSKRSLRVWQQVVLCVFPGKLTPVADAQTLSSL